MGAVSIDQFDLKILAHLQREGRCSNVDLANAIGLSQTPCLARTKRLEQVGVIRGYGAHIALDKLGDHVIVFSEVTISSHRRPDFRKFEEAAAEYREIVECYNVSGGYDYLLKVVAPSIARFQELMERPAGRYRHREVQQSDRLAPAFRQAFVSAEPHRGPKLTA
jgi:DNA-binding Lrp family transcriptional regulator